MMAIAITGGDVFMGEKKVTMRQIAKACGCSLATVSYALNHSGQGKISSATRLRVIDTAKRLNYPTTRTIRGKKNRAAILVTTVEGESAGRRVHLTDLAIQLEAELLALGIPSVILRLRDLVEDWRKVLAVSPSVIFVLDGGCQAVAHVNPPCVTPMIFVDCDNNDPLYYKILPDYPSLFLQARQRLEREDLFLVAEPVRSGQLMTLLTQDFDPRDVLFHNGKSSLAEFLACRHGKKGIVVGDLLGVEVCGLFPPEKLAVICSLDSPGLLPPSAIQLPAPNREKARAAASVASDLLTLDYDPAQGNRILVCGDFPGNG